MLTTANFGTYITPGQRKIFFDELGKGESQYKQIFTEVDIKDRKALMVTHLQGFGFWDQGDEGSEIPQSALREDYSGSIFTDRYHKGYSISWELLQDDQAGVLSGMRGAGGSAKMLARGLNGTIESIAAGVLSDGFTRVGFNGKPLFATNHRLNLTNTETQSNMLTATLTSNSLRDACKMLRSQLDNSGSMPIGAIPDKLIIHADNEFNARSLMRNNFDTVEAASNPENTVPNLKLVVLDYLPDARQWFVKARDIDNLFFVWRERPIFGAEKIQQSMDWFYYGYARFGAGHCDWRGLVGSKGTG